MKIPAKVRLTGKVAYEVVWTDGLGKDTCGECRYDSKQIILKNGLSQRLTTQTFIHEVLHAVEFEYGIPIPHTIVTQLDEALERVLRLNKWIG